MASTMEYLIRTADGLEYGPADEATLIQWAKDGRITANCQIRNTLMNKWHVAGEVPFLKEHARDVEEKKDEKMGDRMARFLNPTADVQEAKVKASRSLNKPGIFKYTPGSAPLRALAATFDGIICLIVATVLWVACDSVLASSSQDAAYMAFTLSSLTVILLYFAISLGFFAQTVGQYFWGLMVLHKDGGPVLMGRALFFTLLMIPFGITTPVLAYCTRSRRALQDLFSGVVVCRTRLLD